MKKKKNGAIEFANKAASDEVGSAGLGRTQNRALAVKTCSNIQQGASFLAYDFQLLDALCQMVVVVVHRI